MHHRFGVELMVNRKVQLLIALKEICCFLFVINFEGFFDLTFTCCSSWLMVCIAFERFCAVWLPHHNKIIFTHRKLFFLVLGIIFTSTIISTWFIFVVKMITKTRLVTPSVYSSTKISSFKFVFSINYF